MALNALKIQPADLVGKLVAQLSNRPTNPLSSGGDNLTAQEVKERYDAYGHLLKDRFNALVDALVADPAVDTDALANTIQVYLGDPAEEDPMSLSDALAALFATLATKYALPEGGIPATDLAEAVTNAIDGKYVKPDTGIPATDLETAVQTSLGKADTAYQKPSGGIPATDLASAVKAILDSAVSQSEFAPVKALAEGASQAAAAENYSALVGILSEAPKTKYKAGQRFLIGTYGVPDVGVLSVEDSSESYTYTTDGAFEASLMAGTLQIGYFVLRPVEGKTNLEDYPTKTEMNSAISGNVDATLSTTGKSADAKAVGDAIDALIDGLVEGIITVAEAEYANASTYSQQAAHAEVADEASSLSTSLGVTDETPTALQPVGGTSDVTTTYQKLNKLVGCKVVKNQLCKDPTFATASMWDGTGLTVANNKATLSGTGSTTQSFSAISSNYIPWTADHIYLIAATITTTHATTHTQFRTFDGSTFGYPGGVALEVGTTRKIFVWKYNKNTTANGRIYFYANLDTTGAGVGLPVGETMTVEDLQISDLTLRYGNSDVVNAIIGNDSSKYFEKLLAFDPNILVDTAYNTGSWSMCKSTTLRTVDYNQWDEVAEVGSISGDDGSLVADNDKLRSKNPIRVLQNRLYYVYNGGSGNIYVYQYDANGDFIKSQQVTNTTFTTASNCFFIRFRTTDAYGTTYNHDICIFLYWDGSRIGYEPYSAHDYTLPNKDLNGILTVKNGKVVADGDELYPSGEGNATRKGTYTFDGTETWLQGSFQTSAGMYRYYLLNDIGMKVGLAQNGLCNAFETFGEENINTVTREGVFFGYNNKHFQFITATEKTTAELQAIFNSSVTIIFPLATPTALTAPTFPSTFYGDDFGTMWFLDEDGNVIDGLQGNEIFYKANVAGFAESMYSEAEGDPDYFEAAGDVPTDIANYLKGLTGYDATKTQTLKNVTGTLTWVDDV